MKFSEVFKKLFSPKPIGTIDFDRAEKNIPDKYTALRFGVALAIILGLEYLFFQVHVEEQVSFLMIVNLILVIYIFVSGHISIRPNYENTGWVPFLVNDPFRISDNVNRFLVFLEVLCLPGKFIFHALGDFFSQLK